MIIQSEIIDEYINQKVIPSHDAWFYAYTGGSRSISDQRQEVCKALYTECERYHNFPIWNSSLKAMFNTSTCASIIFYPIIGSQLGFDCTCVMHQNTAYLLVDLLNIADAADSLKQMYYLLHHLCHQVIYHYLFDLQYHKASTFQKTLERRFFIEGLILYATWNEDHSLYVFQDQRYSKRKEQAFIQLFQAYAIEEKFLQKQILQVLETCDLWMRFPDIAGLFYVDDLYHEQGDDGIHHYIEQGFDHLFQRIF